MAERRDYPERSLAHPHRVTRLDVECDTRFRDEDIGHWVVRGSGGIVRCVDYRQASAIASSFNRCPA